MRILMLAPLQKENFEKIEMSFLEDEFIWRWAYCDSEYDR